MTKVKHPCDDRLTEISGGRSWSAQSDRQSAYEALRDSDAVLIGIGAASAREIDRFNILQLTPDAREVLSGRRILKLRKPSEKLPRQRKPKRGELSTSAASDTLNGDSADVFQALREWRKAFASASLAIR